MLNRFIRMIGGDPNKKQVQELAVIADEVNQLEAQFEAYSDDELSAQTHHFRRRLAQGESLDDILVEAYATVREVSKRTIGLRHYDVQMIGGNALHQGIVAEMKTGEGKTLVATLPMYLNALALNPDWVEKATEEWGDNPDDWTFERFKGVPIGRGVHLITVNDYLARRDARWKAPIFEMLGLTVGVLQMAARTEHGKKAFLVDLERSSPHEDQHQLVMVDRVLAYEADITYGTNSEFGFDYLRDNMKMNLSERVQRGHYYAIIDEVDNVLIDEARTPLIISGPAAEATEWYTKMAQVVRGLRPEDYELSEKDRNVTLTEIGEVHVEELLGTPLRDPERPEDVTPEQARLLGYLEQALRAQYIYSRNKEYVVQGGKIVIVDDFTGRLMPGRRWSDGLHQAVEAKEGVPVQSENVTYATITIQNYFRMYDKLSGMTGTALTEAEEFDEIYSLGVLAIPTNLEYQAEHPDSPLIALQDSDKYGYKFTYYANETDPEHRARFYKRKDYPDKIFRTQEAKLRALVHEIITYHVQGRPILLGTTSVQLSELISRRLKPEPVRRLVQTLLIREVWFRTNDRIEDGRAVTELQPLNQPLHTLKVADLRKMVRMMGLELSMNPQDETNLEMLYRILDVSPERKDRLNEVLKGGIPHQVLNARKHTEESKIIAGAGAFGAVTIATNMAGRGVDIKLGGELAEEVLVSVNRVLRRNGFENAYDMTLNERREALLSLTADDFGIYGSEIQFFLNSMEEMEAVKVLGGLHVIGSERHEARRIDNQLRGRSSRQGDPGSSRFYLSLEDELMVRFGGQQMEGLLQRLRVDDALPIENNLVSRIVESSQTRVEGANFDVRKHLLEYDDVLNTQRAKIYAQRDRIFQKDDLNDDVGEMLETEVLKRVPEALADEGGPWKLLSWLEQIQPPLPVHESIFPSYTLKLLLETLDVADQGLPSLEAQKDLVELSADAIRAEQEHVIHSVETLLEQSEMRMEEQLEERLDALDTFFEGLALEDETDNRGPQQLLDELVGLVRLPVRLTNAQLRGLRDNPDEVADLIRDQVEKLMMALSITRLVGAVQRVIKEDIGLSAVALSDADWDQLANQVVEAINSTYANRLERYIGENGSQGQIAKDLDLAITKTGQDSFAETELYRLMLIMPQGRRAGFDKKTHRRVWMRTTRITYIYAAARLLEGRDPEEITQEVLSHLQHAQAAVQEVWGESELARLGSARILDMDPATRIGIKNTLGETAYADVLSKEISTLEGDLQNQVAGALGRQAITQIYRQLLLRIISELWVEYLTEMEALRVSIGLEAYAQRDPLVQYKNRAFEMFQGLLHDMRISVVTRMFTFRPRDISSVQTGIDQRQTAPALEAVPMESGAADSAPEAEQPAKKKRRRRRRR